MLKKVVMVLLMCALTFQVTACGDSTGSKDGQENDQDSESGEEIPEKPDYAITISVAVTFTGDAFTTMSEAAAAFNASQNDYIIDMYYGGVYGDILTVVQTASPGDIPNIFVLSGNTSALAMADKDCYVPIQKFMDEDQYDDSDIIKFLANLYKEDGAWQVLPWGVSNSGEYWNLDILNKLGIDMADLDSYEDILVACEKIAAAGYKNFYGGYQMHHNDWLNFAMASQGIDYCDNNNAHDGCPSKYLYMEDETCHEAALTYFEFLREMIDRGYMADYKLGLDDMYLAFAAGDLICMDAYSSRTSVILDAVKGAFQVGYHVTPTIQAGAESLGQAPGGSCFFIGNCGNYWYERGAWEFLKYIYADDELVAKFAIDTGYTPVTYSGAEHQTYQDYIGEFSYRQDVLEAQYATPEGISYAPSPIQYEVMSLFSDTIYKMYYDASYGAGQALSDFTDACNEALYLYRVTNKLE